MNVLFPSAKYTEIHIAILKALKPLNLADKLQMLRLTAVQLQHNQKYPNEKTNSLPALGQLNDRM